jgi:hypothetical protein
MTVWRWFGSLVFMAGLLVLVGANLSVTAQDKDKKVEPKKDDTSKKDDAKKAEDVKKDETKKDDRNLVWKAFDPKTVFYQELVTKTTQDMKVMGQEIRQEQNQTFYLQWTADDKKDGSYVVTEEIKGLNMKINIGGNPIAYDSTDEKQPLNPMSDFFKALLGLKLKLTISPKMVVEKIEGQEEFVKKLGQTNPQMEPLLKSILSEGALKQMAEPTWGALPDKKVEKGDKWEKKDNVLDLGPIGKYKTNFTYVYEGKDDKGLDKISITSTLVYSKPDVKNGLPFTIKDATLSSKDGTGVALFDREKGRFVETTMKMKLEGDLTIEVGGMETKVSLVQVQDATSKTFDQPPAAIAPKKK